MSEQAPEPAADPVAGNIPHWSHGDDDPLTIVDGEGVTVYDDDGAAYLDFIAQLYCVNAGHGEERIADAIAEQATSPRRSTTTPARNSLPASPRSRPAT